MSVRKLRIITVTGTAIVFLFWKQWQSILVLYTVYTYIKLAKSEHAFKVTVSMEEILFSYNSVIEKGNSVERST